MRPRISRLAGLFLLLLIAICFLLTPTIAHVPVFGGEGKSPETAIQIENPSKSRVLYGHLASEELRYYGFKVEKGERIVLGLTVPVEQGEQGFIPNLILIGPGLSNEVEAPERLEIPEGYGVKVLSSNLPENPVYEGFTPSAFYSLARLDMEAPESGIYYAAVGAIQEAGAEGGENTTIQQESIQERESIEKREDIQEKENVQEKEISRGGNYGIVIGYKETFTLREWIFIPVSQINIYRWEGQSLLLIFSPLALIFMVGILAIFLKREAIAGFNPARISGILAGLFFLGTGALYIFQMLISSSKSSYSPEVFITLVLILASLGLGFAAIALSLKNDKYGSGPAKRRLYFVTFGVIGLLFWAGLFFGPLLAFEAALLPWSRKR